MEDPAADKEKAEGPRETVEEALAAADARARQGVTNHSAAEEEEQQRQLPPRGQAKAHSPQDR